MNSSVQQCNCDLQQGMQCEKLERVAGKYAAVAGKYAAVAGKYAVRVGKYAICNLR